MTTQTQLIAKQKNWLRSHPLPAYTEDRWMNFVICLPRSLAGHTMQIFGTMYAASIAFTPTKWTLAAR